MNDESPFDVALSFASEDGWLARDLEVLLAERGFRTYCFLTKPDEASGALHRSLKHIYDRSTLNVLLWSANYSNKPKSHVVGMERNLLFNRHIARSDGEALIILRTGDVEVPEDFNTLVVHSLATQGVTGALALIYARLRTLATVLDSDGRPYQHPPDTHKNRGGMNPCEFLIAGNWESDPRGRWESLGDIMVEPSIAQPPGIVTYLIPSARSPVFLSHSHNLLFDPKSLEIKKRVGRDFATQRRGETLKGVLFGIESNGVRYPHLYSWEYDEHLIRGWTK